MSTRVTRGGIPLVDSQSLQLIQSASSLNDAMAKYLAQHLLKQGYVALTPSLLSFLGVLECGVNYGSEIARSLGVTRQMVAKTVKALCRLGYLEQRDGVGKQKEIYFTETGEQLMSDARLLLAEIDHVFFERTGGESMEKVTSQLNLLAHVLNDKLSR